MKFRTFKLPKKQRVCLKQILKRLNVLMHPLTVAFVALLMTSIVIALPLMKISQIEVEVNNQILKEFSHTEYSQFRHGQNWTKDEEKKIAQAWNGRHADSFHSIVLWGTFFNPNQFKSAPGSKQKSPPNEPILTYGTGIATPFLEIQNRAKEKITKGASITSRGLVRRLDDPSFWFCVSVMFSAWMILIATIKARRLKVAPYRLRHVCRMICTFLVLAGGYLTVVAIKRETFFFASKITANEMNDLFGSRTSMPIITIQYVEGLLILTSILIGIFLFGIGMTYVDFWKSRFSTKSGLPAICQPLSYILTAGNSPIAFFGVAFFLAAAFNFSAEEAYRPFSFISKLTLPVFGIPFIFLLLHTRHVFKDQLEIKLKDVLFGEISVSRLLLAFPTFGGIFALEYWSASHPVVPRHSGDLSKLDKGIFCILQLIFYPYLICKLCCCCKSPTSNTSKAPPSNIATVQPAATQASLPRTNTQPSTVPNAQP